MLGFGVWSSGFRDSAPIMENQMEETMENEMETTM